MPNKPTPVSLGNECDKLASLLLQAMSTQRRAGHWGGLELAATGDDDAEAAVRCKAEHAEAEANRAAVAAWSAFYDFASLVREAVSQ